MKHVIIQRALLASLPARGTLRQKIQTMGVGVQYKKKNKNGHGWEWCGPTWLLSQELFESWTRISTFNVIGPGLGHSCLSVNWEGALKIIISLQKCTLNELESQPGQTLPFVGRQDRRSTPPADRWRPPRLPPAPCWPQSESHITDQTSCYTPPELSIWSIVTNQCIPRHQ